MGILSTSYDFISALIVLLWSIIQIPFLLIAWVISVGREWRLLALVAAIYGAFYFVGLYGATAIDKGLYGANKVLTPYYEENIKPILYDIIGRFYNRVICWLDGLIYFPYGFGRFVVFPIVRDGGGASTVFKFVLVMKEVFVKLGLEYFLLVNFVNVEADFTTIHAFWIDFFNSWQSMLCYGCEDLCPLYTKFPIFPMILTSDQWKDPDFLGSLDDLFNGLMIVVQQTIKILKQYIYGNVERWVSGGTRSALLRPDFRRAFDLWVRSGTRFWKSCETSMNVFWTNFVPVIFRWEQMFTPMVYIQTTVLRMFALTIQLVIHHKEVFDHFSHTNSTYWIDTVKEDYKEIIGLIAPASSFAPIDLLGITSITHYDLDPTSQAKPNGLANPLFGVTTLDIYQCVVITRILCDPGNVGVTCAQKYQGTLLEDINLCCPIHNLLGALTDFLSIPFEITLHLFSANDLMRSADKQPFTTVIKDRLIGFFTCFYEFFRVVPNYGYCIEKVLLEITNFVLCTGELLGRVLLACLTLPYYERFMPGECNFISCGQGVTPVAMAVKFLDRIADTTDPNGMINCLSFLLDTGFQVPFAGCNRTTCDPSRLYIPPLGKKRRDQTQSIYNRTAYHGFYAHDLTPIMNYRGAMPNMMQFPTEWIKYQDASPVLSVAFSQMRATFSEVYDLWGRQKCDPAAVHEPGACAHPDLVFQRLTHVDDLPWNPFRHMKTERLVTQAPVMEVNCPTNATIGPCFDIACLAKKVTELATHTVAFSVRAANAFIQSRTANGSTYFTGEDCLVGGSGICLQKDLTEFIVDLIAPIDCLCQLIKLLLPNKGGFEDPCCAFTIGGELLSCTAQVIINIGNSIGGDAPNYTYITDNTKLQKDFVTLLKLALATFDCVCNFIRKIFAVVLVGAGKTNNLAASFDPCCIPRTIVKAILAAANMFFKLVMSMSTLTKPSSQCYMYVNTIENPARIGCVDGIPMLPVMRDFALITNSLFSTPPENELRQCGVTKTGEDSSKYGGATCVCRLVNSILAMLFKAVATPTMLGMSHNVSNALDATTAPTCYIDLCCPIYRISQILENSINFVAQFTWSFVQNWQDKDIEIFGIPTSFWVPMETFNFFFCDEYGSDMYFSDGQIDTASLEIQQPTNPLYGDQIFNPAFDNNTYSGNFLFQQQDANNVGLDTAAAPGYISNGDGFGTPASFAQALAACQTYTACTAANPGNYNICGPSPCPKSPTQNVDLNGNIVPIKTVESAQVAKRKCGKLEPIIIAVYNLLSRCMCPSCNAPNDNGIGNLADNLLQYMLAFVTSQPNAIFPFQIVWPKCFCCGGPTYDKTGIVTPFASAFTVFFRQILILARNIANPNYWAPSSGTLATNSNGNPNVAQNVASSLADNLEDIKKTWISRFLAPFLDALCRFFTNSACLLSMLLGQSCSEGGNTDNIRYKVISSVFAYASQALIRIIAVIEAAVKLISQELPGQCVGPPDKSNYNANLGTDKQGNDGNEPIPTCSQKPIQDTVFKGAGAPGKVDPQDIGRIMVSIFTFIVDAFIGVGALGCTTICPGLQYADPMKNLGQPSVCMCYNLSPYIGISVSRCSFAACAKVYDFGGSLPFKCLTGDPEHCDGAAARYGHTNISIGNIAVDTWFKQNRGICQDGCDNVTGYDNYQYDGQIPNPGSFGKWEIANPLYKFIPVIVGNQLVCQSKTQPVPQNILDKMQRYFGTSMQVSYPDPLTVPNLADKGIWCYPNTGPILRPVADGGVASVNGYQNPDIDPGFAQSISSNFYSNDVYSSPCPVDGIFGPGEGFKKNYDFGGLNYARGACQTCLSARKQGEIVCNNTGSVCDTNVYSYTASRCLQCLREYRGIPPNGLPQSPDTQSVCNRKLCTSKGWCKNDQLVPCARGYGQPVLDGVIITALKYVHCLIGRTFGSTPPASIAGDVIKGIIKGVTYLLSIIWQLSGGFIRFGVAVFVFNLRWMQGISAGVLNLNLADLANDGISLFNSFAAIFTQPVIAYAGVIPEKRDGKHTRSFETQFEHLMHFEDAHDCIDSTNIRECICKTIRVGCDMDNDRAVIAKVAQIFDDNTECSSVWKHISGSQFKNWIDIRHSTRYEASVCLTKRSRGESWRKRVDTFPENYFYSSRGIVDWMRNVVRRGATRMRSTAETADEKVRMTREKLEEFHSFKKRFGMTHTQYLEKLNIRYEEMRRHLMQDHGYTQNSIMLDPIMMLDSYWYRYQSGYWGHLGSRMLSVLRSGDVMLGSGPTFGDTLTELGDSYVELRMGFKMALPHLKELWSFLPEQPEIPTPIHIPTWPWNLPTNVSHVWHGIKERMPEMEMPTFNWGPKLTIQWPLELPSIQWNDEIVQNWNKITGRFIVGGNCRIYDGAIEQGRKIIDYCSTEFVPHLNRRPTLPAPEAPGGSGRKGRLSHNLDYREIKRASAALQSTRTNLHDVFISWVESIFGISVSSTGASAASGWASWFANTNLKPSDFKNGDTGFLYWATFEFRCEFPENLDCSIGIGLREAIKQFAIYYGIAILAIAIFLPGLTGILAIFVSVPVIVAIIAGSAWHYSFSCAVLFPSVAISPLHITLPILPVPLNVLPTLPFCMWDEILDILGEVFTKDYKWIPDYMFYGDRIGFIDCRAVGVSDGLENLIFFGYQLFGGIFLDVVLGISSTVLFRSIVPGLSTYMQNTVNDFRLASPTLHSQQLGCAVLTAPAMVLPIAVIVIIASFVLALSGAILQFVTAFLAFIRVFSFIGVLFDGSNSKGDQPGFKKDEEEEVTNTNNSSSIGNWISMAISRRFGKHKKME